jgi:hypothetical protein
VDLGQSSSDTLPVPYSKPMLVQVVKHNSISSRNVVREVDAMPDLWMDYRLKIGGVGKYLLPSGIF